VHASKSILGKEFKGKDFGKIKKFSKYYVLPSGIQPRSKGWKKTKDKMRRNIKNTF
jgi:hypothetical protein